MEFTPFNWHSYSAPKFEVAYIVNRKKKVFLESSREWYSIPTGVFELSWPASFGGTTVHPSHKEFKHLL